MELRELQYAKPFPCVLTIAGSDSGGGAGIQADIKTFAALGAYGTSAITAVTAQNTQGVQGVHVIPPEMVRQQCESVLSDIRIDAVKIGMLPDAATIRAVAEVLGRHKPPFVVLDPVLVATSGDSLALENTVDVMLQELLPLADLITPNLNELAQLTGNRLAENEEAMLEQGRLLMEKGAKAVLLKGGHWENSQDARDWLVQQGREPQCFISPRIPTLNTHGTGCTLSSAIAAYYPSKEDLRAAVSSAKSYLQGAIEAGANWKVGKGRGPLAHFWRIDLD
ncbi:MAG: bifunctional hydroxymethylpyrimidine kinase/phosphomethylpyrimidine kinase [Neisseria sp.]|uniref:bifunctional hydroxymethylpyrimidine kinase/phosphomethylpyrimidine kinase n=1 Tax=Neisseria sp. TaxID=192066 RepID=UPI0026DBC6FF|nr:bifunctional hydroxymethylpyrimidine kinase/phosphomethylpyrimidine kinase [Neisseria sp.]MDO4641158.1 bifunctional hydroxymethylpyrimidine kinase/phosphomethylpyrimidine kinase [Neisseria sp.]